MHGMQVLKMVDNPHYLYRMTVLVAIASLAPVVAHDVLCGAMLPVVVNCSHDKVCSTRQPGTMCWSTCPRCPLWGHAPGRR